MSEFGVVTGPATVKFERRLPGPIERAWEYLTVPEKRARWLAGGEMELRVGGRVTLEFDNNKLSSHREPIPEKYKAYEEPATMIGRITQCEPPTRLSFTWNEAAGESHVIFELIPKGKDVLLVLTHERLPNRTEMIGVSGGWHTHLAILDDEMNGRDHRPFWSTHMKLEQQYEQRIP